MDNFEDYDIMLRDVEDEDVIYDMRLDRFEWNNEITTLIEAYNQRQLSSQDFTH